MLLSKAPDVGMGRLVKHGADEDGIDFALVDFMFSEGTVALHEVVNINNFPHSESVFAQPFD